MEFEPARLRKGELIVGAGGIVLLASMFVLKWYGVGSGSTATSVNGWNSLSVLRWWILVTVACSLALVFFQATRRSPAIPASLSVIVSPVGLITLLALIYRVIINPPGSSDLVDQKAGAFVGLVAALAIFVGGYLSMRQEGIRESDGPGEIEIVTLGNSVGS